jgi:predicted DNA-binding protein (MmcQ/YjbR family)
MKELGQLLVRLCERSYDLVVAKLTEAQRILLGYQ